MTARHKQEGFTAVEILISLFITAAFIATGFQLFSVVTKDGHEARLRAEASSIAAEYLQLHKNLVPIPCVHNGNAETFSISTSSLPGAYGFVNYSCHYGAESRTSRINVGIYYGTPNSYGVPSQLLEASLDVTR